ncbi:MAG: hypothetical protein EOP56_04620 [Sphingobacteriales bacterium]|nr:MAG: hypothetical protein EOP56_04620 [Sphingobacteriales bacterium]
MRNFSKPTLAACAALTLFAACSKDDKDGKEDQSVTVTPTKSKKDMLVGAKWQMTSAKESWMDKGQSKNRDLFADMVPCEKDDFIMFTADGKVTFDLGPTQCDTGDKSETTNWEFIANDTKIIFSSPKWNDKDTLDVVDLTDNIWKTKDVYKDDSARVITGEYSYKRIN